MKKYIHNDDNNKISFVNNLEMTTGSNKRMENEKKG